MHHGTEYDDLRGKKSAVRTVNRASAAVKYRVFHTEEHKSETRFLAGFAIKLGKPLLSLCMHLPGNCTRHSTGIKLRP